VFIAVIFGLIIVFNIVAIKQSLCFFKIIEDDKKNTSLKILSNYNFVTKQYYKIYNKLNYIDNYLSKLKDNEIHQIMAIYLIIIYLLFFSYSICIIGSYVNFNWFTFLIGTCLFGLSTLFHFFMIEVDTDNSSNSGDISIKEYNINNKTIKFSYYNMKNLRIYNDHFIINVMNWIVSISGWLIVFLYINFFFFFENNYFTVIEKMKDYFEDLSKKKIDIGKRILRLLFVYILYHLKFRYTFMIFSIMIVNHIVDQGDPNYKFNKKYIKHFDIGYFVMLLCITFTKSYVAFLDIYNNKLQNDQLIFLKFYILTVAYLCFIFLIVGLIIFIIDRSKKIKLIKTNNLADIILKQIDSND
jgi:hypothetical protein